MMVQEMDGGDVVNENSEAVQGFRAGGDVDQRIIECVRVTLRTGNTFGTCSLFQT